jgi:hypothetical protein
MTPEEFMNIEHTDFPNTDDNDMEWFDYCVFDLIGN